jgi:putative membrane protein
MIERYADHASNERTLLAWVRTGIAFIAFGFVLEKFHVVLRHFLVITPGAVPDLSVHDTRQASEALVVFGLVTIAGAILRFVQTTREISSTQPIAYSPWPAVAVGAAFFGLGSMILISILNW